MREWIDAPTMNVSRNNAGSNCRHLRRSQEPQDAGFTAAGRRIEIMRPAVALPSGKNTTVAAAATSFSASAITPV
jgi:hypothetical protein